MDAATAPRAATEATEAVSALLASPIARGEGPGWFLRAVLLAAVVGVVLFVWALARASRSNGGGRS